MSKMKQFQYGLLAAIVFLCVGAVGYYTIDDLTNNAAPGAGTIIEVYDPTATPKSGKITLNSDGFRTAIGLTYPTLTNLLLFPGDSTQFMDGYSDWRVLTIADISDFDEDAITNAIGMNLQGEFDAKQPTNNILTRLGSAPVTITFADPLPTDASLGCYFRATLTDNFTLANPINPLDGQRILWELIQDGTGSRLITLGDKFALGSDITAVTLTTTLNKRDFLTAVYNSTADKWYVVGLSKGY